MAQFYGNIIGNRGESTRASTKAGGMTAHIRGSHVGCRVEMRHDDGEDVCYIYATAGEKGRNPDRLLGIFRAADLHPMSETKGAEDV